MTPCGCGGSTPPPTPEQLRQETARRSENEGGMGQPGYTWDGPKTPAPAQAKA